MMSKFREKSFSFRDQVLEIITKIPRGKVLSYGQVATLAGAPRASRIVGGILYHEGHEKDLPWQRVVNRLGKVSTHRVGLGEEQVRLLKKEGIHFNANQVLDLKRYQWRPPQSLLKKWAVSEELCWDLF